MAQASPPSAAEVCRISNAATMQEVLLRDHSHANAAWWMAVISTCNSGMIGAESGEIDAENWACLLVEALDAAAGSGALGEEEVIHRRIIACAAALRYFGVKSGDSVRDPDLVFSHLVGQLGGSIDGLLSKCRDIVQRSQNRDRHDPGLFRELKWLSSARIALESLRDVVGFMDDGSSRSEAVRWCKAASAISGHPRQRC